MTRSIFFALILAGCTPVIQSSQSGSSPEVDLQWGSERPDEANSFRATPGDTRIVESGNALPSPHSLTGSASWYRWHPGEAAAGPSLRTFLGTKWRGMTVTVCALRCIRVKLTDLMRADRLIDLDSRTFAELAPLSRGLLEVTVSW